MIENRTIGRVVAVGTLIVEHKFVHLNGKVGHIEDIAVANDQQGNRLGQRVIQALQYIGQQKGCYKIILDCATNVRHAQKKAKKKQDSYWSDLEYPLLREMWIP